MLPIALVINCELCGLSVQGNTEPEVLEKATEHIVERHPEAADDLSTDTLRARIQQV
jgi:predicted small metal-binding protein